MEIIPVIDLKGGQVVHARRGEREAYRPVRSPLCASSDPVDVARSFLGVHAFAKLYVADLDAIEGRGDNLEALVRLRAAVPDMRLWVDSGLSEDSACRAWLARGLGDLVIGSETLADFGLLGRLEDQVGAGRVVLSLDFRDHRLLGPDALLEHRELWPRDVIVITLSRVGSDLGPDLGLLRALRTKAAGRRLYVGGGVRGIADLVRLGETGAAGALVATALHEGRIGRHEIEQAKALVSRSADRAARHER